MDPSGVGTYNQELERMKVIAVKNAIVLPMAINEA